MVPSPLTDTLTSEPYDVVVIGAGPSGSSAARAAGRRGAKVLLVDRKQRIGEPVRCGEFVTQWICHYAHFSSNCVQQTTETLVTHLPDETAYEMRGPGYMLNRAVFDRELAALALSSNVRILIGTKALDLSSEGVIVIHGQNKGVIKSKVIIGADGVHSSVAHWLGLSPMKTIVALQYEVATTGPQNQVHVFFQTDYPGGYGWFFPKGKTANVGIGIVSQKATFLPGLMANFLDRLLDARKIPGVDILGKTGGSIPCDTPRRTVFENILLVGDAACHTHSITGAGILNAVVGGEMAGRIAAEAARTDDIRYLENYETEWREAFGGTLSHAASKRLFLEESWGKPGVDFKDLVRKNWIGFRDYYKDRKRNLKNAG